MARQKRVPTPILLDGQVELELMRVGELDAQDDILPRAAAVELLSTFKRVPVVSKFAYTDQVGQAGPTLDTSSALRVGTCDGLRLDGQRLMATLTLNEEGSRMLSAGAVATFGGLAQRQKASDKVWHLLDLKLEAVALSFDKIPYRSELKDESQ